MKRNDSDCDDVYSEESSSKEQCSSPGDSESCQMLSRKKRRGIIEKRRRDRINNSLAELRRLVPTAFEKQGSAKLEKAEILQMTVDHLKMLHAKGLDALAYDPHKFAMDYHSIGFRECAAEVARYLVTVEGMDIQDPLRLRLMSHLQCFAAQRELANKQASTSWGFNHHSLGTGVNNPYSTSPASATSLSGHMIAPPPPPPPSHVGSTSMGQTGPTSLLDSSQLSTSMNPYGTSLHNDVSSCGPLAPSVSTASSTTGIRHPHSSPLTPVSMSSSSTSSGAQLNSSHQYHVNLNSHSSFSSIAQNSFNPSTANMKPYRPWGAEVAY